MWLEYVNFLIEICTYIIHGDDVTTFSEGEITILNIIGWTIFTILVLVFISWWLIPLRILLIIKFR